MVRTEYRKSNKERGVSENEARNDGGVLQLGMKSAT